MELVNATFGRKLDGELVTALGSSISCLIVSRLPGLSAQIKTLRGESSIK